MRHILSSAGRAALGRYASSKVLLAFDYDGTLAPIVGAPGRARMRPATRRLLARLAELYPCVVISGRARADVLRRVRGTGVRGVVGNHGLEPLLGTSRTRRDVRRWRPLLAERLSGLPGVTIEDKAFSLAVHYRQSRDKRRVRASILKAVEALGAVRVIGGKQVLNVLPGGAAGKGAALRRERERLRCATAVYVGDDETDEDVFGRRSRLLPIRVGRSGTSSAAYYLRNQAEIDVLMRMLLRLRQENGIAR